MIKNCKNFLGVKAFLFIFLFISLFYLTTDMVSALEVNYPVVSGQNINTELDLKLPSYVKYLFNAGVFLGFFAAFFSLTIAGVMYFLSPISVELKANAKDRISGAISGILILVLTYLIIVTINPQLSFLNLNELEPTPPPPAAKKTPGVYLYKNAADCPNNPAQLNMEMNMSDLGSSLRNRVNSVGIIQNFDTPTPYPYISILYDKTNLWGKCFYITTTDPDNPDQTCQNVDPWAASASVYKYDPNPTGDGVYFYHKSCFNHYCTSNDDCITGESCNPSVGACVDDLGNNDNAGDLITQCNQYSGGWYKVSNEEIKNGSDCGGGNKCMFTLNLNDTSIYFNEVPEGEQDCIKYDKNGECISRDPPYLGGENISSMIIHGDYIVLFVYQGPGGSGGGPWTYCQEFPTPNDVDKLGPQQIKWQNIRNNAGVIPNYAIIIPIKKI